MPKRIQMTRQTPWRKGNPDAVIVSRPTEFGNPFAVNAWYVEVDGKAEPTRFPQFHPDAIRIPDTATAVHLYRRHIRQTPGFGQHARRMLAGHDLACWCPVDQPCHADVLLELANEASQVASKDANA